MLNEIDVSGSGLDLDNRKLFIKIQRAAVIGAINSLVYKDPGGRSKRTVLAWEVRTFL